MVVTLLDDVAVDLAGDLLEFVGDSLDGRVLGAEAGDVGDDEVSVVHRVLDGDNVLLAADFRDVDAHSRFVRGRLEIVQVEFDVIPDASGRPIAENFVHETHRKMGSSNEYSSYVRRSKFECASPRNGLF